MITLIINGTESKDRHFQSNSGYRFGYGKVTDLFLNIYNIIKYLRKGYGSYGFLSIHPPITFKNIQKVVERQKNRDVYI